MWLSTRLDPPESVTELLPAGAVIDWEYRAQYICTVLQQ